MIQGRGEEGPLAELQALTARLAEVADAVETALVDAEVDAVAARIASVEAVAAEHLAERHASDERHAHGSRGGGGGGRRTLQRGRAGP